jgi:hypothetical protein
MIFKYLSFSLSIVFISFIVGMIVTAILKKMSFYVGHLSNLNIVKNERVNKWIGVDLVKWIVLNTPFKYLNQKLKMTNKIQHSELLLLRRDMTSSEIDHLNGFIFVSFFAFVKFCNSEWLFGLIIMIVNILMNLHPSLIQQQNKRRIDKLLKRFS